MAITPSLATALYHLRPETTELPIWIDQICINQTDSDEQTSQVKVMDRIYRSSHEALVWLGPGTRDSEHLMRILIQMGRFAEEFKFAEYFTKKRIGELIKIYANEDPTDPDTIWYHKYIDEMLPLFTHKVYASLIALQKRKWFQRSWVLQEYALPEEVTLICGRGRIKAETFMAVLSMIGKSITDKLLLSSPDDRKLAILAEETLDMNTVIPFTTSRQRRKAFDEKRYKGDTLYQLLQRAHVENSLDATMPCDRVYGLLGLAVDRKEMEERELKVSYDGAEKTPEVIFTRTARALVAGGKVDVLLLAQHCKGKLDDLETMPPSRNLSTWKRNLSWCFTWFQDVEVRDVKEIKIKKEVMPSWVPDWRNRGQRSFAWLRDEESPPLFKVSEGIKFEPLTNSTAVAPGSEEFRTLKLKGYRVDEIEKVGDIWEGGPRDWTARDPFPWEAYLKYLEDVRQMCQDSMAKNTNIYATEQRRLEAEWRVPVGDIEQDASAKASRAKESWKEAYDKCVAELHLENWKSMTVKEYKARLADANRMRGDSSGYRLRMIELKGKRPLLSRIGYVGMGPKDTRSGDVIVIFGGASLPFIVRPVEDGKFRLVGECYCDGFMDGEIVTARKNDKQEEEVFTLI